LKLKLNDALSNFAFNFDFRRYIEVTYDCVAGPGRNHFCTSFITFAR